MEWHTQRNGAELSRLLGIYLGLYARRANYTEQVATFGNFLRELTLPPNLIDLYFNWSGKAEEGETYLIARLFRLRATPIPLRYQLTNVPHSESNFPFRHLFKSCVRFTQGDGGDNASVEISIGSGWGQITSADPIPLRGTFLEGRGYSYLTGPISGRIYPGREEGDGQCRLELDHTGDEILAKLGAEEDRVVVAPHTFWCETGSTYIYINRFERNIPCLMCYDDKRPPPTRVLPPSPSVEKMALHPLERRLEIYRAIFGRQGQIEEPQPWLTLERLLRRQLIGREQADQIYQKLSRHEV